MSYGARLRRWGGKGRRRRRRRPLPPGWGRVNPFRLRWWSVLRYRSPFRSCPVAGARYGSRGPPLSVAGGRGVPASPQAVAGSARAAPSPSRVVGEAARQTHGQTPGRPWKVVPRKSLASLGPASALQPPGLRKRVWARCALGGGGVFVSSEWGKAALREGAERLAREGWAISVLVTGLKWDVIIHFYASTLQQICAFCRFLSSKY